MIEEAEFEYCRTCPTGSNIKTCCWYREKETLSLNGEEEEN